MKYWFGYLTAGILLACSWALRAFAKAHSVLVDMIYPYVSRMAQTFLAGWSSGANFCMWQTLLLVAVALTLGLAVLVIVFKWNPIRWLGWLCTAVAAVVLLNTCLYGLNDYSGPLSEDVRLEETDYTITELENATLYYLEQASELAAQVQRDAAGNVVFEEFDVLAVKAADGFDELVYGQSLSVFAGPTEPVKKLGWTGYYTARGITGVTVGLTGEAAVNPKTPGVLMPFAMCREMARRASITNLRDTGFAAYMACMSNKDVQFRYSGALMGYRYCLLALQSLDAVTDSGAAARVAALESAQLRQDLAVCNDFYGRNEQADVQACKLLTSWHIQEVVLPTLGEEEAGFNPMDKTQVDLSDHPNA